MSKRKPNSAHARMVRYSRAMLRTNHVAVLDLESSNLHTLINWKSAAAITTNARRALVDSLCDIPHNWTIYLAGLHRSPAGVHYMKSEELALDGIYLAAHLEDVIGPRAEVLRATCNPKHFVGMAWIAMPYDTTLTETHAAYIFERFGAWSAKEAA